MPDVCNTFMEPSILLSLEDLRWLWTVLLRDTPVLLLLQSTNKSPHNEETAKVEIPSNCESQ